MATSPSLNLPSEIFPSLVPKSPAISSAKLLLEFPAKIDT